MKRYYKFLVNSIIMTAFVIGILCAIYYIADRHHFRFDLTKNKKFSLTVQSVKLLERLDREVEVTAFFLDNDPFRGMAGDLLEEYRYRSAKFKYKLIDPEKDPAKAKEFGIRSVRTVVFKSGDSRKDVQENEMVRQSYNPYMQVPPEFIAEEAFTNALAAVTVTGKSKVCFIEGHGERRIDETDREGLSEAKAAIEKDNYETQRVELITEHAIPPACDVVVVASPQKPLFENEIKEIERYLAKGGAALVMLDPENTTNLKKTLKKWNAIVGEDVIVDRGAMFFFGPLTPIPSYAAHEITGELQKAGVGTLFPGVRSITERTEKPRKGIEVEELLRSSNDSWAETELGGEQLNFNPDRDKKGPVPLALAITRKKGKKETRLVVVGDSDFASNKVIHEAANSDLILNMVNWLAGESEKISIRPRSLEEEKIMLSGPQAKFIFYFTVFAVPIALLLIGGAIWLRRRYM